ncbi:MAG: hypothetical protein ACREJC_11115 [Tepidisphaeraceae bacterium]
MAYSASNPPRMLVQAPGGLPGSLWYYESADAVTVVRVTGYFANGHALGMQKGDLVLVCDNDASPITGSIAWVTDVTVGGQADLSDGTTITGTDTD